MRKLSRAEAIAAHSKLLNETLTELIKKAGKYFRNEVGKGLIMSFKGANPRPISYGLCVGSSDIVGFDEVIITPDMVGKKIAVFSCYEIKTGEAVQSVEQKNFQKMVESSGGKYQVIRNKEDVWNT